MADKEPDKSSVLYPASFEEEDWRIVAQHAKEEMLKAKKKLITESWWNDGTGYIDPYKQVSVSAVAGNKTGFLQFNPEWVDAFRETWQLEIQKQIFIRMKEKKMLPGQPRDWKRVTMQEVNWWGLDQEGNVNLLSPVDAYREAHDVQMMETMYAGFYAAPDAEAAFESLGMKNDIPVPDVNVLKSIAGIAIDIAIDAAAIYGVGKVVTSGTGIIKNLATKGVRMAVKHPKTVVAVGLGTASYIAYRNGYFSPKPMTQEQRGNFIAVEEKITGPLVIPIEETKNPSEAIAEANQELEALRQDKTAQENFIKQITECQQMANAGKGTPLDNAFEELKEAVRTGKKVTFDKNGIIHIDGKENQALRTYLMMHRAMKQQMQKYFKEYQQQNSQTTNTTLSSHAERVVADSKDKTPQTRRNLKSDKGGSYV